MAWLDEFSLVLIVAACLLLGLAPFTPEPHVWEKLKMLMEGRLIRPLDIFDLLLHGAPFVVLLLKLNRMRQQRS
ncbi:RND transporter [Sedimenticola selenatireducens]|uniref:RND transporter n=1 Tax=Sedimenticola selenatireducens TaxID=191960 RepID=A0A557SIC0_9GAMM|nr:RND transporter [Sedimenticola selenatireducens]TVO77072.1 RND transporter [Sedimenticola selenatireducens]TVT64514.1 MAG: RND transporter [Sedimenticola selenatireducens]